MGGKSTTSTQSVAIPPEVLARYSAVNKRAENVAQQPFQQYGGEFVAPINQQQQAGFGNINQAATSAQPYYQGAAGMTLAGSQGVGQLGGQDIQRYMSPYLGSVVGTTLQNLGQEQAIQRQGQIGEAIKSGAFGGDRSGLAAANLARQQGLAYGKTAADLMNTGYGQAVQTATGQQQIQQADLARLMQGGAQLGGLGAAQQQAALQGAQAQVGAGTLQQQTDQAQKTAEYQQFLQQRGYDFQVAQFLANIAMGTGALSGSTTTTTQPQSLFSDERLKENIEPVGELNDGQTIYRYNYKGDPRTQIGLIAQDVEQSHPEAVGESQGYRTVDYGRATDDAAMASRGGLVPEGMDRAAFAPGGMVDPNDLQALIASQAQSFSPFSQAGLYGGDKGGGLGKSGYVPGASLPVGRLMTAGSAPQPRPSGLAQAINTAGQMSDFGQKAAGAWDIGKKGLKRFGEMTSGKPEVAAPPAADIPAAGAAKASAEFVPDDLRGLDFFSGMASGGLVPGYAGGGGTNPYEMNGDPLQDVLEDQSKNQIEPLKPAAAPSGSGGSGVGDALKAAGTVASIFSMFSDARLKDNIEPVGKLYDGQPVYRYDMGGGPTQIGLMAQEAGLRNPDAVGERDGYMTLDYDRATQDAAGLMPRQGFKEGGGAGEDEDLAIRTIASEMSGKSPEEARAIAAVIENRRKSGRYGDTFKDVVQAKGQFEPWSRPDAPNYPMRFTPESQRYKDARAAFEARGDDPTGGAQNFYSPTAQKALGRPEPSWARGREGMDIGQTRFVNLGEPGLGGAKALAAERGAAPRGSLSEPVDNKVLGLAPPKPFGTEREQGWGDFLTSRQFIVPLLSGIGAAATTPTRNLGTAIAAGLGAGAQAYGAQEQQQAGVEKTRAETRGTETETYQKSFMQTPQGNFVWIAGGGVLPAGEYDKLRREGRAPALLGRIPDNAADVLKKYREAQSEVKKPEAPGAVAEPTAEGIAAPVGKVEKKPLPPTGIGYDEQSQKIAQDERKVAISGGAEAQTAQKVTDNYLKSVVPAGNAARDSSRYLSELAANLSEATQGKGLDAPGFGFDARAQVTGALNMLSGAFGGGEFGKGDSISQINKKIETLQAAVQAAGGNQESFAALDSLKKAIASPSMSPRAYSKLAADLLTQNQRAIDREQHRSMFANDSSGLLARASEDFERTNPSSKYNKEADVIQRMILTKPQLIKDLRSGKYTPAQIDEAFDKFGVSGMSRYFVGGR